MIVNCGTDDTEAYRIYGAEFNPGHLPPACQFTVACGQVCFVYNNYIPYRCDGTAISGSVTGGFCLKRDCVGGDCVDACGKVSSAIWRILAVCLNDCVLKPCGTLEDMRTPAMKLAGCCPLNPITGLPF
jgi:hypothetical protein